MLHYRKRFTEYSLTWRHCKSQDGGVGGASFSIGRGGEARLSSEENAEGKGRGKPDVGSGENMDETRKAGVGSGECSGQIQYAGKLVIDINRCKPARHQVHSILDSESPVFSSPPFPYIQLRCRVLSFNT